MLLNKPHCGISTSGKQHHIASSVVVAALQLPAKLSRGSTKSSACAAAGNNNRGPVASRAAAQHRSSRQVAYAAVDGPSQELDEVEAETKARVGWDPAGILPPLEALGTTDHFARRARYKQQQQNAPPAADGTAAASEKQQQAATVDQQHLAAAAAAAYSTAVRSPQDTQKQQQQQPTPQHQSSIATAVAETAAAEQVDAEPPAAVLAAAPAAPPQPPAAAPAAFKATDPFERIPAKWLAQGGIPAADTAEYDRPAFVAKLAEKFIPIDLDFPGLRIVNFDPAVFTIDGFMTADECSSWQQHALDSGCLQQSKIGGGNAASAAGGGVNTYGSRRTSSSLLMDSQTQAKSPGLTALMHTMQQRGQKLLAHLDEGRSWGPAGKLPAGGQYCYESPQVARYMPGQHFLAHEDAFPALLAAANGFQRHATLLLYLNNVQQGGATHFDHLGISVQPKQGMALLFFPAYANGTADPRSLHTAQDAVDTKWVMQQWIARGYPVPKAVLKAVKVAALAGPEVAASPEEPVREVFRVPVTSSSSSSGPNTGSKKRKVKSGGSKKGFSRR